MALAAVGGVVRHAPGLFPDRTRDTWLIQHLLTFLFFYVAVWFFYCLVSERFQSWKTGLLGALFMVLSPRIFADSFYNPKDLPLMSMSVICLYTLVRYLNRPSFSRAAIHGLACALLIDIRIIGILAPALTVLFAIGDLVRRGLARVEHGRAVASLATFMLAAAFFTVLFWPALWSDPVRNFVRAFRTMSRYPWYSWTLYLGRFLRPDQLPWHYTLVWIAITTPLSYSLLFLVGVVALVRSLGSSSSGQRSADSVQRIWDHRVDFLCLLWFAMPIAAVIAFRSALYDGWRQLFYIYPAFILLALVGFRFLWDTGIWNLESGIWNLESRFEIRPSRFEIRFVVRRVVVGCLLGLDLLGVAGFMIKYHPHENVYFNILAGRNMSDVRKRFEMDYWGLAYRQLLEHILQTDTSSTVRIGMSSLAHGMDDVMLLPPNQARRVTYDPARGTEHYFLSEYRWHPRDYGFSDEYYAIRVNGGNIAVAYRVHADEVDSASAGPELIAGRRDSCRRLGLSW
jgi:hypothetical protein